MTETGITPKVEQRIPTSELPNEEGRLPNLLKLPEKGPLVFIFYRDDR